MTAALAVALKGSSAMCNASRAQEISSLSHFTSDRKTTTTTSRSVDCKVAWIVLQGKRKTVGGEGLYKEGGGKVR